MGGVSSLFEENDWECADGKLTNDSQTIDGFPPTKKYSTFSIVQRVAMVLGGQRDYDVLDEHGRQLYTTRGVYGTLAWFDVLRNTDEYLLRVQVDLSRRFWVVYSYDVPAFVGQLPDQDATEKLDRKHVICRESSLYRKMCMTISLTRSQGVVSFYGPPSNSSMASKNNVVNSEKAPMKKLEKPESVRSNGTKPRKKRCKSWNDLQSLVTQEKSENNPWDPPSSVSNITAPSPATGRRGSKFGIRSFRLSRRNSIKGIGGRRFRLSRRNLVVQQSLRELQIDENCFSEEDIFESEISIETNRKSFTTDDITNSLVSLGSVIKEPSSKTGADPAMGVLQTDCPILKVEEIKSLIGQHQTMLPTAYDNCIGAVVSDNQFEEKQNDEPVADQSCSYDTTDDKSMEGSDVEIYWGARDDDDDSLEAPSERTSEDPLVALVELYEKGQITKSELDNLMAADQKFHDEEANLNPRKRSSESSKQEQPLVGYWSWEHTLRVHKMTMHLAKNSDLCLHVILAIITNQLRYERNAAVVIAT